MPIADITRIKSYAGVVCPQCKKPLDHSGLTSGTHACVYCQSMFEAVVYNPGVQKVRVASLAEAGPHGATACVNHPRNAAVTGCERCGSFICNLCKIGTDGLVLCPGCFERLSVEGALPSTVTSFKNHFGAALTLALFSLAIFNYAGPFCGPAVVYYCIKALRQKKELGETDGLVVIWLTIILGVLEFFMGVFVWIFLVSTMVKI